MKIDQIIDHVTDWLDGVHLPSAQHRVDEALIVARHRQFAESGHAGDLPRLCRHEAAHAAAAIAWGGSVQRVRIFPSGGGSTEYLLDDPLGRLVTSLAAPCAELLTGADSVRQHYLAHSADVLSARLRIAEFESTAGSLGISNRVAAITSAATVVTHWRSIVRIAAVL